MSNIHACKTIQKAWREFSYRKNNKFNLSISNSIKDILSLPYFKNECAVSGLVHNVARHEDALSNVFKKHGFLQSQMPDGIKREDALEWSSKPFLAHRIPNGTFIEQPFGTHNSPDFIVKVSNKLVLFIEAKSSTGTYPLYNSGGVKENFLYVFCSQKTNQTTIYRGESVISIEQQRLIDEHIRDARKRDEELNQKLKELDINHRGICYYTRPMINQSGGKSYTDYFSHAQRKKAENDAIEWIKSMCYK